MSEQAQHCPLCEALGASGGLIVYAFNLRSNLPTGGTPLVPEDEGFLGGIV